MLKKLLILSSVFLSGIFLSGCTLKQPPAALQIKTTPVANVFVDGQLMGKTPYQSSTLKASELTIKLIPEVEDQSLISWERKVKVSGGVLTLIEREFGLNEAASSGQIITLEKIKDKALASLSIVSDPDGSLIKLDSESKGFTPLTLDQITEADHEIIVSKDGYSEKTLNARAVLGYKLIINVKLAQLGIINPTPTASPLPSLSITPAKTTPVPGKTSVIIKDTPTGWLRVRSGASLSSSEIAKVNPGEKYALLEEASGWYKIAYEVGKEGWVSSTYATPTD
ncbi:hypothetical protein COT64_00565 [Candidatus Shapirobacteria bacterium CG09_land_8_20_14_0_10_39_12]|uniref:SH3b domain-containing protein n=1 Tax=Candidatus Shapirobacteria bacterium CG09_land_8_20_14_0_10_39_12 TaxID=1974885 RepID=A0A2H0WQ91_9BACT|nr:MAG: hypothetical protein COT64_00565 [Candidatus Shapirobacteria bacterium CG09_land_8_20_14_0_10_39_12]